MRHVRSTWSFGLALAAATAPATALADPPPKPATQQEWAPPVEGVRGGEGNIHDAPLFEPTGERRRFTFTYNPLTLFVVRAELSFEALLTDHHALQLTGHFGSVRTNEVYPASCPSQTGDCALTTRFRGGGGEIGYRWYSGTAGPRGLYVAPSFLAAYYVATPAVGEGTPKEMSGADTPYWNLGGALDVGWQQIFADRWVAGAGLGLQYTVPTHTFPPLELPASVYATRGLRPRLLVGLGVAFD